MTITRYEVSEKLLAYLNSEITLAQLVDWAEKTFIDDILAPEEDIEMLNDILSYLAASDTVQFPLTWDICTDFLNKLGLKIKITASE